MTITFSTCWYIFKAKFDPTIYQGWIHNMLSNVNNYNLVVYCDSESYPYIEPYLSNPRIVATLKSPTRFSTSRYEELWKRNHEANVLLRDRIDWKLNMLWSEKINFVKETISEQYFDTEWHGWCDIGYFRGRSNDSTIDELKMWPSDNVEATLDRSKIYYACVNNHPAYIQGLSRMIQDKNSMGLPRFPIPPNQVSIAGGFFLCHRDRMPVWHTEYYVKLLRYLKHGVCVKDDQIIIADCVFSNMSWFHLCQENDPKYDNWFMFQRLLM